MSVAINSIRQNNQKRRTLERQYDLEDSRKVAHYDDEAKKAKKKSLDTIASDIKLANAGVDREVLYLDKICVALAQQILIKDGVVQPEGNAKDLTGKEKEEKEKAIRDYWTKVDEAIDKVTTKKIEDDGSEAEAASECKVVSPQEQEIATTAEESVSTSDTDTETESANSAENESTEPKTTSETSTETASESSSKRKAPLSLVPKITRRR